MKLTKLTVNTLTRFSDLVDLTTIITARLHKGIKSLRLRFRSHWPLNDCDAKIGRKQQIFAKDFAKEWVEYPLP